MTQKWSKVGITATVAVTVAVLIVVSIGVSDIFKDKAPSLVLEVPDECERGERGVSCGWSIKNNETEAVEEAYSLVRMRLLSEPIFVILFSTSGYDSEQVLSAVRNLCCDAQVYGGTSSTAVLTKSGFHAGEKGSLALLAVASKDITFSVAGVSIDNFTSAREAGKAAILSAINATGRGDSPKLILLTTAQGEEEEVLAGIEEVIGKEVPVIGGSAAKQFANELVFSNGISLAVIYTDLKVGFMSEMAYMRTEARGRITKVEEKKIIKEIDNRPAADVYNTWTGGIVSEELVTCGTISAKTVFYPLAKVLKADGKKHYRAFLPLAISASDRTLTVSANVKEGDEVVLMFGDWERLLDMALLTPTKALESEDIQKEEVVFGFYTYCAEAMHAIPEEEHGRIPALVEVAIGDAPFIGSFSFRGYGHFRDAGNFHGQLVNSMVVFGEKEDRQ